MPTERRDDLVVVEHLDHHYDDGTRRRQVLCEVSLRVAPGEIVLITGPSGSGKSTLLTVMGALRAPQAGKVRVLGCDLRGATAGTLGAVRRAIGFVFQHHGLLAPLSVGENVEMALLLADPPLGRAERRRRAGALLEAVGLGERATALPATLSTGERQRVALARALANEPPLLLADEPTASLDARAGRVAVEHMHALARARRCAVVIVTHDDRIRDLADRVLRLEDGRLRSAA
ncbi:MAG: ATP-binding cassette domain-containing protein [Candidatus Binatia bacterium]